MKKIRKILIGGLILLSALFANYDNGFAVHLKNNGSIGSGLLFGYKIDRLEFLAGYQILNISASAFGESVGLYATAPCIGGKIYVIQNEERQLGLYLGGDYGIVEARLKSSDADINDSLKEYGANKASLYFYSLYLGAEYFLNIQNSFSVSTEYGYKSLDFFMDVKNIDGLNNIAANKSETYMSIGINYYF